MTAKDLWYKPKLIEVALPLEDINRESAREKSIRHGHPSTLHLWWARRPLAACRAVLFAQLVDDPSAHPEKFPTEEEQKAERERLHSIISRLVVWENIHDEKLLKEAHDEILKSTGGNPPPILDPFAGGGSIPLEAQRLGLEAHASDLNPVAVLINKALIEIPPKWAGQPPSSPAPPPSGCPGQARPAWRKTYAATASGCATRPRSGSATSTPRSRSPAWTPRSSPGSGRERSPAPTRPAQARCPWSGRSGSARRRARSATSSRSRTASGSASRSAAQTAFPAKARWAAPVQSACSAAHRCRLTYIRAEGKAGRWAPNSWQSPPRARASGITSLPTKSTRRRRTSRAPTMCRRQSFQQALAGSPRPSYGMTRPGRISSPIVNSSPSPLSATW